MNAIGLWTDNPVFRRELHSSARRGRAFLLRVLYGGVLGLTLWAIHDASLGRGVRTASELAAFGRDFFWTFFWVQMVCVTLAGIVCGAESLLREIREDTLGLLALTALDPFHIAAGKWAAALAQPAGLILCGAPVLAICVFFGGIGAGEVVWSVVLSLCAAALGAAYAVRLSTQMKTPLAAGLVSIAAFGAHAVGAWLVRESFAIPLPGVAGILHPFPAAWSASEGSAVGGWQSLGWIGTPLAAAGVVALLLRSSARLIADQETLTPRPVQLSKEIQARRSYAENAAENLGFKWRDRPVSDRFPLLWKEVRTRPAAHVPCEIRLFILIMAGMGVFACLASASPAMAVIMFLLLFLLAVPAGAALFVRDREARRWEPILASPLRARDVVSAKLFSTFWAPEGLALLAETALACVPLAMEGERISLPKLGLVAGLTLAFIYMAGAAASLFARGFRSALAMGALGSAIVLIGVPWLDELFPARGRFFSLLNPFVQLGDPGWNGNLAFFAGVYVALIAGLWLLMIRRFDREAGRV